MPRRRTQAERDAAKSRGGPTAGAETRFDEPEGQRAQGMALAPTRKNPAPAGMGQEQGFIEANKTKLYAAGAGVAGLLIGYFIK
jgi:hypothetical protein